MATELEQLSVTLSAKIDDFKRGMQDAVREFDRDAGQIEQRNSQLTQSMEREMTRTSSTVRLLSGALKTFFSVYAIEQFISKAIEANSALAKLGDTAKSLQLSSDQFQRLGYAGKTLGGLSSDDVGTGALSLQQKANKEVREGEGELTRLLEANNQKLTDRSGKVKDVNALLEIAATLVQNARSEADKVDIARLFGLTDKWVEGLDKGPVAFKNAQAEAGKVGAIINSDLIAKAKQFDDAWNHSWNSFAQNAKSAAVEAAGALRQMYEAAKDRAGFEADPKVLAQIAEQQAKAGGGGGLEQYFRERSEAQARRVLAQRMTPEATPIGPEYPGDFGSRNIIAGSGSGAAGGATLPGQVFGKIAGGGTNIPTKEKSESEKDDAFDREIKRLEKSKIALEGQAAAQGLVGKAAAEAEASARLFEAAEESGIPRTTALELQVRKLAEAYAEVKAKVAEAKLEQDLIFQRAQLGRSSDEQAIYSDLRGRGVEATERNVQEMQTLRNLTDAKEGANSFIKGMITDMENGVRAGKALENQLKRILEKLSDKALDKLISGAFGGIGGLFGGGGSYGASDFAAAEAGAAPGAFGPGFASGGLVGRDGKPTWIPASALRGARQFAIGGGVPAILHAGEIVLNQAQQKNVAQSMSQGPRGPINLTHAPVINGTGLSKEEVFSVIQRSQKEFSRQIGPIFSDWQRRYG
jgi:hypothetical protein